MRLGSEVHGIDLTAMSSFIMILESTAPSAAGTLGWMEFMEMTSGWAQSSFRRPVQVPYQRKAPEKIAPAIRDIGAFASAECEATVPTCPSAFV